MRDKSMLVTKQLDKDYKLLDKSKTPCESSMALPKSHKIPIRICKNATGLSSSGKLSSSHMKLESNSGSPIDEPTLTI